MKYRLYNEFYINHLEIPEEEIIWHDDFAFKGVYMTYILINEEQAAFLKLKFPTIHVMPE